MLVPDNAKSEPTADSALVLLFILFIYPYLINLSFLGLFFLFANSVCILTKRISQEPLSLQTRIFGATFV